MIQSVLSITGEYADLWDYLKSLDHALERAINTKDQRIELFDLDYERLNELADFFQESCIQPETDSLDTLESLSSFISEKPTSKYTTSIIDFGDRLNTIPVFQAWLARSKPGFEKKVLRLIVALREWVEVSKRQTSPRPVPEEFIILHAILSELMNDTQAKMYK